MCARLDTTGLLADVTYAIVHGDANADKDAGRERGRLYRRVDGGYWMTSDLDLTLPFPRTLYIELHAGADWRVESLRMRLSGNDQRDATHQVDGLTWRATIQTDEATIERAIPFAPGMHVDFDSVWSAAFALNRLKLAPGQTREVDAIRIELPSLEPVSERWRFHCVGPEHIITPASEFDAMHYVSDVYHWWADSRGIIVAADGYRLLELGSSRS